jgi:hypothetical protein
VDNVQKVCNFIMELITWNRHPGYYLVLRDALFAGVSEEDIQLDVGHCQKSCRSLFSLTDLDFAVLESSFFKVSLISMYHVIYTSKIISSSRCVSIDIVT